MLVLAAYAGCASTPHCASQHTVRVCWLHILAVLLTTHCAFQHTLCVCWLQELELSKDGKGYRTVARCPIHFVLAHDNKGFEGLHLHEHQGHRYMMGLCEGEWRAAGHVLNVEDAAEHPQQQLVRSTTHRPYEGSPVQTSYQ
jgi:hypothetical protein